MKGLTTNARAAAFLALASGIFMSGTSAIDWPLFAAPRRRLQSPGRSRYEPHQGKRECARRRAQMARARS